MLAGSWRYSCRQGPRHVLRPSAGTGAGDRTGRLHFHFGHSLHAAPPPLLPRVRRTIYIGYCKAGFEETFAPGESPNDVLYTAEDAFIPTADVAGKAAGA